MKRTFLCQQLSPEDPVCFCQGIKARDLLHQYMEKAILEKLQRKDPQADSDALDFIMDSAKEHGKELTMQELKVTLTFLKVTLVPF